MSEDNVKQLRAPALFIGIPTYDGKIEYKTVRGLVQLSAFCAAKGIRFGVDVVPGDAFIGKARNTIATRFMNSGFDELLFIDADIGFTLDSCKALLRSDADIVSGIYRVKEDRLKFPALMYEPPERHAQDDRLIKMQYVPAGFLRIRRKVFEKMAEMWPDEHYFAGEMKVFDFFPAGRVGTHFTGEDISFCEKAIKCGFDIWGVQGVELIHTGVKAYDSNWQIEVKVAQEMNVPIPDALGVEVRRRMNG